MGLITPVHCSGSRLSSCAPRVGEVRTHSSRPCVLVMATILSEHEVGGATKKVAPQPWLGSQATGRTMQVGPQSWVGSPVPVSELSKTKMCKYFMEGSCKKGAERT